MVRAAVVHDGPRAAASSWRSPPGRANRARVNRAPVTRPRDVLGILRTVLFAPEDLALVRGDPAERRRFLDELLVARAPAVRRRPRRLRPGARAALRAAQDRRAPAAWRPAHPRRLGRAPRPARRRAAGRAAASWSPTLAAARRRRRTPRSRRRRSRSTLGYRCSLDRRCSVDADAGRRWRPRLLGELRAGAPPGGRARGVPGRPAPRRPGAAARRRARPRGTPATASPGRSRWRCGWRRTGCCGPTASSRC